MFGAILGSLAAGAASSFISNKMSGGNKQQTPQNTQTPMMSIGQNIGQQVGQQGASYLTSRLFSGAKSKLAAKNLKKFNQTAYPGTNPWEQLGGNSAGGQIQTVQENNKAQKEMQNKELSTRKYIAELDASTKTNVANISATAPLKMAGIQREKLPLEIQSLKANQKQAIASATLAMANAKAQGEKTKFEAAKAKVARELLRAQISKDQTKSVWSWVQNAITDPSMIKSITSNAKREKKKWNKKTK